LFNTGFMMKHIFWSVRFLSAFTSTAALLLVLCVALAGGGCVTGPLVYPKNDPDPYREVRLREGDTIKITFPGAAALDSTQQVRRDGKITISLGGEMSVMGKTPAELEKEIVTRYGDQLATKQVVVTLPSSAYPIFVTGAVLRPGKITADRPLSALEAIMEAGGFDFNKANLKAVTILRQTDGRVINYKLNLQEALKGPKSDPFYVKPADILYVPEKFSWF
jgi:polysaccharide export outer membrane protein